MKTRATFDVLKTIEAKNQNFHKSNENLRTIKP